MDDLQTRIDRLDDDQRERLSAMLAAGLVYYGSPYTWHAVSLLGLPQNDPGDILRDGSEVNDGYSDEYRPGQLALRSPPPARRLTRHLPTGQTTTCPLTRRSP